MDIISLECKFLLECRLCAPVLTAIMTATTGMAGLNRGQRCKVLAYLLQGLQYFRLMVQEHLALVRSHIHIISAARHAAVVSGLQPAAERFLVSSCNKYGERPQALRPLPPLSIDSCSRLSLERQE